MNKKFNSLTSIVDLHTSPESLKIKREQGLDAWCMYTIILSYIRKYKGLNQSSQEYFYFRTDVKRSTQMKEDRINELEKYFLDQDILFLDANSKMQHSELFNYLDTLGDTRRKAIANRWIKAEARDPKEQNKEDEIPVNSSVYQRLNKIKIDGSHNIKERDLLAIARAFPEDVLNYFIDNLQVFKKASSNVKASFPFCLGEWKLIDHLKKHWENKLELKKELPSWVLNTPNQTNNTYTVTTTTQGNANQPQRLTIAEIAPKYSFFYDMHMEYRWSDLIKAFIRLEKRTATQEAKLRKFFQFHTIEEWKANLDHWYLVDNISGLSPAHIEDAKKINIDRLKDILDEYDILKQNTLEVTA